MNEYSLNVSGVSKRFDRRVLYEDISVEYNTFGVYGIAGQNGSGKSTFVKILAGVLSPSKGSVVHSKNGTVLEAAEIHRHIGFAAPYIVLYDEFTAEEQIRIFSKIRGIPYSSDRAKELFDLFSLYGRRDDLIGTYSSGMKQRMKFIAALYHEPELLLLDEPVSNLDNAGKEAVYSLVQKYAEDHIVLIASNEDADLAQCSEVLQLSNYERKKKTEAKNNSAGGDAVSARKSGAKV